MPGMAGPTSTERMQHMSGMPGMTGAPAAGMHRGTMHGDSAGRLGPRLPWQQMPLGTVLTVEVFDADPATGAAPIAELTATVGETSEVAFADELEAASSDAAFLRISVSERTRRIDVAGTDTFPGRAARLGVPLHHLEIGESIEIAFYAADGDVVPSTTLSFHYGEDSAAAFQSQLAEALEGAAVADVTLPALQRIVNLKATPFGAAMHGGNMHGGNMHGNSMFGMPNWPPHR